jgi:hypothetical protein
VTTAASRRIAALSRLDRPVVAALVAVVLHLPFVLRYDLHFQPDFAISVLMSRAIAFEGEHPAFFWGQAYLGTWGCWLTALLFRLYGVSIPLAGLVALAIWAIGVALATALAHRLFGARAAWWTGLTAAVASPYANHYVTQPYSSYETAPVLALLVVALLPYAARLTTRPLDGRVAARWIALGVLLGAAWWTTRLFLPALVAAAVAVAATARWEPASVRRAAAGLALLALGAVVGDAPELLHRPAGTPAAADTPPLAIVPAARLPEGVRQALLTLPAYLNGDPRAREPEGVRFAEALESAIRREPATGPLGRAHDGLVLAATIGLLTISAWSALDAWRRREPARLAVCALPFVQLVLIAISGHVDADFYRARRYWFGCLLVLPLLAGNAVAVVRGWGATPARVAAAVLAYLVGASLVSQARLLRRPDELADYRTVVRQLAAGDEEVAWMASWNAWVIAALSGGSIQPVSQHYNRRPVIEERAAAADEIAVVVPHPEPFPLDVRIRGRLFVPAPEPPRSAGRLRWMRYHRSA